MAASENLENLAGTRILFTSDEHLKLTPEPTKSPNDPLNWSPARKYWHAALVLFIVGFTAATSNDVAAAQYGMNSQLGISWTLMNTSAGILFIGIGYGTLLTAPIPSLYGRRMMYIVCLLSSLIGCTWLARTMGPNDALWNQLFIGASEACAEATAQLSLSDLFFEQQRGSVMGLYVLATSIGTYLGPLLAGFIANSVGWRWVGWFALIISFGTLIVFYFTFEETTFDRKVYLRGDMPVTDTTSSTSPTAEEVKSASKEHTPVWATSLSDLDDNGSSDAPKPYWQRIALVTPSPLLRGTGFVQYLKTMWHILRVFSFPGVWYSGLQWGAQDAWLTFYLTVEDDDWVMPPWNYSPNGAAMMNIPTLIGAIIGCCYGGWFSDKFVEWYARRNNNLFEAEYRLWLMYPAAFIGSAGLILFGIGTDLGMNWPAPYVGLGMIGFGWGCAGDLSLAYLQDAYPEMVLEGMVGVSVINNSIGCIFTFCAGIWLNVQSTKMVFVEIGILSFVFMMTTVPMMTWGKAARRWTRTRYENFVSRRDGN
ncbi:uncharacterized protein PFLUO_LOCUS6286 [Penicillium psychrofluorescens]|uniref:uncharacterized protein n=1 Tax=Penicillium psychrofluorescens TaxID=3158075 RepID=UPI003CCDA682